MAVESENAMNEMNALQKHQSTVALNELSAVVAEEARGSVVLTESPPAKEDVIEATMKKSALMLARNIEAASKADVTEELIEEVDRTVERTERSRLKLSPSMPPLESLKGEEFIRFRQRGSIFPVRRASMFPLSSIGGRTYSVPETLRKSTETEPSPSLSPSLTSTVDTDVQTDATPSTSLSAIEAAMIMCVLRECINQLDVVSSVIPAKIEKNWSDNKKSIDEKYGVPDEPTVIFREDMGLPPLLPSAAKKIQRERTYVREVLNRTMQDLKRGRNFATLEREASDIARMKESERSLEATCQLWRNQVDRLREEMENEKASNERELKRISTMTYRINTHVDTAIFVNGSRLGYVERWENARLEQQNFVLAAKEQELMREINRCSKMQSVDRIISGEVCAYLEEDISKLQNEIEMWTDRYNEELVRRQQEIDELKERVEEQKLELQDLRVLRDRYQIIINERNAQLERERIEAEHQAKTNKAAVVIQSVWRGYMVRHQLGQYKDLRSRLRKRKKLAARARKKAAALKKIRDLETATKKSKGRKPN